MIFQNNLNISLCVVHGYRNVEKVKKEEHSSLLSRVGMGLRSTKERQRGVYCTRLGNIPVRIEELHERCAPQMLVTMVSGCDSS